MNKVRHLTYIQALFQAAEEIAPTEDEIRRLPPAYRSEAAARKLKADAHNRRTAPLRAALMQFPHSSVTIVERDIPDTWSDEELFFHMPWLAKRGPDEWSRNFARGMLQKSRNRHWQPSKRQREVMTALVAEKFADNAAEVIE